jgi:hypothetical protein
MPIEKESIVIKRAMIAALALAAPAAFAQTDDFFQPVWSFANVSLNYLDWSNGTEDRTSTNASKGDFFFLELEGGVGYKWGEFYGFADLENPGNHRLEKDGRDNRRSAAKVTSHIYLGESPFSVYLHVYDFRDFGFNVREQDQILGLGYRHTFDNGLWFKPFLGAAHVTSSGYTGMNGYMLGWVAGYDFKLAEQNFSVTNWHEQTFERNRRYLDENYVDGSASELGTNGAVALWWHPVKSITAGVQYRYSHNKLGTPDDYQNATIYTVKYNFK